MTYLTTFVIAGRSGRIRNVALDSCVLVESYRCLRGVGAMPRASDSLQSGRRSRAATEPRGRREQGRRQETGESRRGAKEGTQQRASSQPDRVVSSLSGWDLLWYESENERERRQQLRGGPRRRSRGADDSRRGILTPNRQLLMSVPFRRPPEHSEASSEISSSLSPPSLAPQRPRRMAGDPTNGGCSGNPPDAAVPGSEEVQRERMAGGRDRLALLHRRIESRSPAGTSRAASERGRQSPAGVKVEEMVGGRPWDFSHPFFVDHEVQEVMWVDEGVGGDVNEEGWATMVGKERVVIYLSGGGMRSISLEEYCKGRARAQSRTRCDGVVNCISLGARRYLEQYRDQNGRLPSSATWKAAIRGEADIAGDYVGAWFRCCQCGQEKRMWPTKAKEVDRLQKEGRESCALLLGVQCQVIGGDEWATPRGGSPSHRTKEPRATPRVKQEPAPSEDTSSVEITGYSAGALQFFKTTTKYLKPPEYAGSTIEMDFKAWQRGVERYFETYGIEKDKERVTIGAALLTGDAAAWWHSMWMSGRDEEVTTWEELQRLLRERFLPPEGEMNIVGQWKRCRQIGTVGRYADYVHNLKALCPLGESAEFRIAFHGLRYELQAELRKHMRQNGLRELSLTQLFALAADAEVGLGQNMATKRVEWGNKERGGHREEKNEEKSRRTINAMHGGEERGRGREGGYYERNNGSNGERQPFRGGREQGTTERRDTEIAFCGVCGEGGHQWYQCGRRYRGPRCACCGSRTHRIALCPQAKKKPEDKRQVTLTRAKIVQLAQTRWEPQLLYYPVKLNKKNVSVMLDSGASVNCIDEQLVATLGGVVKRESPGTLFYPDQRPAEVKGTTEFELSTKGFQDRVLFWVVAGLGVAALLGEPWLRRWNPRIDWRTQELQFSDGVIWKPVRTSTEGGEKKGAWKKATKKEMVQFLQQKQGGEEGLQAKEQSDSKWLQKFATVFEAPSGTPPDTRICHVIRLKKGAVPYQKTPYRLSVDQRAALEQELTDFIDKKWIQPSWSAWATVPLVVPKKDGNPRICIDYRRFERDFGIRCLSSSEN